MFSKTNSLNFFWLNKKPQEATAFPLLTISLCFPPTRNFKAKHSPKAFKFPPPSFGGENYAIRKTDYM